MRLHWMRVIPTSSGWYTVKRETHRGDGRGSRDDRSHVVTGKSWDVGSHQCQEDEEEAYLEPSEEA